VALGLRAFGVDLDQEAGERVKAAALPLASMRGRSTG
jgi:hypothetical protein